MISGAKNRWKLVAGLSLAALTLPAFSGLAAGVGDSPAAAAGMTAASTDPATAAAGGENKEVIQITFKNDEQDILTQQAVAKLDEVVESLVFSNADLGNVIRLIGERLDMNFIFDSDNIKGNVTMRLNNVRLRDALDSILSTRQLAMIVDPSGIFRIVPQAQVGKKSIETKTEVIQLNWVSAVDTKETLKTFVSDDVGRIEANEESNVLIITDVPPNIEIVKELISHLDKPERQVEIEARLVDINIGALRDLGTEWNAQRLNSQAVERRVTSDITTTGADPIRTIVTETFVGGNSVGTFTTSGPGGPGGTVIPQFFEPLMNAGGYVPTLLEGLSVDKSSGGKLSFGDTIHIFGNDYNMGAAFTALETRGIVEVLANPRVTTLNNVPANIEIIENIPYTEAQQAPTEGFVRQSVEFEQAGVRIDVKPIITPNGYVNMRVKLAQSIFRARVGLDANLQTALAPPQIDERNAETNVIVSTGSTVALGGLRQLRSIENISGVPWLHQIPFFGWLFKTKSNDQSKTELVLMVTPNILEASISLRDRDKSLYDRIDAKWHIPDYFFDDVSNVTDEDHKAFDQANR